MFQIIKWIIRLHVNLAGKDNSHLTWLLLQFTVAYAISVEFAEHRYTFCW